MPRPAPAARRRIGVWVGACVVLGMLAATAGVLATIRQRQDTLLVVDGWELTRTEFLDQLGQISRNQGYLDARARNGQAVQVFRPGTAEYEPAFVVEFLNERVTFRLASVEVAKRGAVATEEDRARAMAVIEAGLADPAAEAALVNPGGAPAGGGRSVLDGFGSYRDVLVAGVTDLQVLQRVLGLGRNVTLAEGARLLYDGAKDRYANQACGRHLVIKAGNQSVVGPHGERTPGTDAEFAAALTEITAIKAELDGGADFATVAAARSQDVSTKDRGGDLGCAPKGRYTGAFEEAMWNQAPGAVGAPVRSELGYHLVLVTERRVRTFEEVLPALEQAIDAQGQEALRTWLDGATKAARVEVDPAVGTWDAELGTIVPPGGTSALTLVPDTGAPGTVPVGPTTPTTPAPAVPRAPEATGP